jgi:hypothetical protein
MNKPFPALCLDCRHSKTDERSPWTHKCFHPKVVASDNWALACNYEGKPCGSSCVDERRRTGWFAQCGIKGKLWEPKNKE